MISFLRDDNAVALHDVGGLRPDFATIARANTGASITELDISGLNIAANRSQNSQVCIRVAVIGSNACYFSVGAAGSAPGTNATMIQLPANSVSFFKIYPQDKSAYHQQNTGAVSIEIAAMV